jgi:hypothetical protein
MYALTLRRPWAWAVAKGGKDIENRGWLPDRRLPLGDRFAFHAGQGIDREACEELQAEHGKKFPEQVAGIITCTVIYAGWVHEDGSHSETLTKAEAKAALRSDWFQGPYGWVLRDVQAPPRALAGRVFSGLQGLWVLRTDAPRARA